MIIWPARTWVNKRIARWGLLWMVPYIFCDVDRYGGSWITRGFCVPTPAIAICRCLLAASTLVKDALNLLTLSLRALVDVVVLPGWWINEVGVELLELHFLSFALPLFIVLPVIRYRWCTFLIRLYCHISVPYTMAILIVLVTVAFPIADSLYHF